MAASPQQNNWVLRVLGLELGSRLTASAADLGVDAAKLASLSGKTGKLAAAARPTAPPKSAATSRLLGALAGGRAPEDPRDVPEHVARFVPGFLATIETERPVASKPLAAGEKLSGQDRILGLADLFAAAQRSLIAWEDLLSQAEATNKEVDALEKAEARDERAYGSRLAAYNMLRARALEAEARALPLMEALQARFNGLSADQQQAAAKEAARA